MDIRLHVPRLASNIVYKFVTNFVPLCLLPPPIGLYQSLQLSVRILHWPTLEARNTELRYALLDASRMQMYRSSITVESEDLEQVAKRKNVVDIVNTQFEKVFLLHCFEIRYLMKI